MRLGRYGTMPLQRLHDGRHNGRIAPAPWAAPSLAGVRRTAGRAVQKPPGIYDRRRQPTLEPLPAGGYGRVRWGGVPDPNYPELCGACQLRARR